MKKFIEHMLKFKGPVVAVFLAAAAVSLVLSAGVGVNYDMVDYLPEQAPSTLALKAMESSYDEPLPNLRVMVRDVTIPAALEYKAKLKDVPGVIDISWLDDQLDLKVPLEVQDQKVIAEWYVNDNALFSIALDGDGQADALAQIREIIGEDGAISGNPLDTVATQSASAGEITRLMAIMIPVLVLILLLTTASWAEPLLFMANLGVAIALNLGTNIIFGEISFVTNITAAVLQLACSMDYSIFLLDRFEELRREGLAPRDAMVEAVSKSASSILASGLTTVMGFVALCAMQFRVGPDMGIVLAKGMAFSLLTTLLFMPCLIMYTYKLIDKTTHRSFMPSFKGLAVFADKSKAVVAVLVLLLIVPCFLGKERIDFTYGMSKMTVPGSQSAIDRDAIEGEFGKSTAFALLVPKGETAKEMALGEAIKAMPEVSDIKSYVESIGNTIPAEFIPEDMLGALNSEEYTRMAITSRVDSESEEAFAFVQKLRDTVQQYYPDTYHLVGEVANIYDMKTTITADNVIVTWLSVGGIALIVLLTFRSLSIPVILLLTIESAIFINMSIPYFLGQSINYIGYLIISSVQLGATVDYAILFTNRYIENRGTMPKKEAVRKTVSVTAGSIFVSGGILTMAGSMLWIVSSNMLICQFGMLLARGTILSMVTVIMFLPAQLYCFDGIIQKTTYGLHFFKPEKRDETAAASMIPKKPVKAYPRERMI